MRIKIKDKVRFAITTIVFAVILFIIIANTSCIMQGKNENIYYKEYTVSENDTLWDIAKPVQQELRKDIREIIFDIEKTNNISACELYPGMVLLIPSRSEVEKKDMEIAKK